MMVVDKKKVIFKMSITIKLQGGLGNQLFQVAALDYVANLLNEKTRKYIKAPTNFHSSQDYFSSPSIFSGLHLQLQEEHQNENNLIQVNENNSKYNADISYVDKDWVSVKEQFIDSGKDIVLFGYFQHWKYVTDSFIKKLVLPDTETLKGAFIHLRGGDYVNHFIHGIDLRTYYKNAVKQFPSGTHFYIFTNDQDYAQVFDFKNSTLLKESNEVTSLALMSRCTDGGSCANSTFSWWAGFLNRGTIVVPDTWSSNKECIVDEGYFHPRFIKISTSILL